MNDISDIICSKDPFNGLYIVNKKNQVVLNENRLKKVKEFNLIKNVLFQMASDKKEIDLSLLSNLILEI